jgi:hypothetical protein
MQVDSVFPNLGAVSCTQLTFGGDIRLSPSQVGAIRDAVLAQFPLASVPPWYFGEIYRHGDGSYEIAASISPSQKTDPLRAYNAFFRIQQAGESRIDGPGVLDLLGMIAQQDELSIYCTASFIKKPGEGSDRYEIDRELYRDDLGKSVLESYSAGLHDGSGVRIGVSEVRWFEGGSALYAISFFHQGAFGAGTAAILLNRAVSLLGRVYVSGEEATDAGR